MENYKLGYFSYFQSTLTFFEGFTFLFNNFYGPLMNPRTFIFSFSCIFIQSFYTFPCAKFIIYLYAASHILVYLLPDNRTKKAEFKRSVFLLVGLNKLECWTIGSFLKYQFWYQIIEERDELNKYIINFTFLNNDYIWYLFNLKYISKCVAFPIFLENYNAKI